MYGVMVSGAIIVPLNTRLSHAEITAILNDVGAEVLYIHKEFLTMLPELQKKVSSLRYVILAEEEGELEGIENKNIHSYEHLLKTQPDNHSKK